MWEFLDSVEPASSSAVLGASAESFSAAILASLSGASVMFFKYFFGIVGIFEILIAFLNEYWDFLDYFKTPSLSLALGSSAESL